MKENLITDLPVGNYRVEAPENVELGGKIDFIKLCRTPLWKTVMRYILYVCTGFVTYLLALWIPCLKVMLKYSECIENEADWVIVYGADSSVDVVPFSREQTSTRITKVFVYRLFKYYYDENACMFRPAQFNVEKFTNNRIHSELGLGLEGELVRDNAILYGENQTDIPKKPCMKLLFDEVLSPFYIFQIFSFVIWYLDDYIAYSVVICVFSAISISMSLIDTISTTNKLQKMSYYEIPVSVIRRVNGSDTRIHISSSDLVPGDIMVIPENVSMPCDAVLLNGACIMNEAMLTGESIPVVKNALPHNDNYYNPKEDKQYTLYAGTKCIQARYYQGNSVLALVTLTGFRTMKGELIRTMLFPKPSDFKFYADSFKFIAILAGMAVCGFLITLPSFFWAMRQPEYQDKTDFVRTIIIKAAQIITVTVPPALPTCMQIGVSIAIRRLKRKQTYCISPSKINEAGRVNVMCFDKTGTLTEDGLDLLGVRPVTYNPELQKLSFTKLVRDPGLLVDQTKKREQELENFVKIEKESSKNSLYSISKMLPSEQMLEIMASCHSLTLVQNKMIGDPLDLKMFDATAWQFEENDLNRYDSLIMAVVKPSEHVFSIRMSINRKNPKENKNEQAVGIVRRFDFSSKLQRMSVIVKNLNGTEFKLHMKGSPEKIRELCDPSSVPDNFHSILEKYTEEGYRVLACASKNVGTHYKSLMAAKREDLEFDLNFIGFLIMENKLKPVTTEIIDTLHNAEIRTIMVTGDNALTAISVAKQCHIVGYDQRVFLGDISEHKVKGKNFIVWKDFEFSGAKLNDNLEPENDTTQPLKSNDHNESNSPIKRNNTGNTEQMKLTVVQNESPTLKGENLDYGLVDLDPPFFNLMDRHQYCIAITGKAYSMILHEAEVNQDPKYIHMFNKLMRKCVVFARMHPDEKASMISHMMQNKRNTVGMCGDGANDVGALKAANVGVSLSEAEASIAAPFTSKVQDISCIPTLLKEGRAALATSYQAFKYMALYSVIQFTSVTIMYFNIVEFTNWHYYHIDLLIILPVSATMAMSQTYDHLSKFKPTGRLISVQILVSVFGQAVIQIVFQLIAYGVLVGKLPILRDRIQNDPEMIELTQNYRCRFGGQAVCTQNSTLYLISIYQYLAIGLAFLVGKPFRKSFYTNFAFTGTLIFLILFNLLITYNPFSWRFIVAPYHNREADYFTINATLNFPTFFGNFIVILALINTAFTVLWERIVVKQVSLSWKNYKNELEKAGEDQLSLYAFHSGGVYSAQQDTSLGKKAMTELSLQL